MLLSFTQQCSWYCIHCQRLNQGWPKCKVNFLSAVNIAPASLFSFKGKKKTNKKDKFLQICGMLGLQIGHMLGKALTCHA